MAVFPLYAFGNLAYFTALKQVEITFEVYEHFPKQTFRNRFEIIGANGIQKLTVPIQNKTSKSVYKELKIAYAEPWRALQLKTFQAAYANSPFYFHYAPALQKLYEKEHEFLMDFNTAALQFCLKVLKWDIDFQYTTQYEKHLSNGMEDFRNRDFKTEDAAIYYQNFQEKHGFVPNLSILDLLFMEGPNAATFL